MCKKLKFYKITQYFLFFSLPPILARRADEVKALFQRLYPRCARQQREDYPVRETFDETYARKNLIEASVDYEDCWKYP